MLYPQLPTATPGFALLLMEKKAGKFLVLRYATVFVFPNLMLYDIGFAILLYAKLGQL